MSIQDQIARFKTELYNEGKSGNTVDAYVSDIEQFFAWIPDASTTPASSMAAPWLNEARMTKGPATVQRRKSSLKAYFRIMHDSDPLVRYKAPPAPPGLAHPLPNLMDDVRHMLDAARGQARIAIALCGFAGLRIAEALDLRIGDVDFNDEGMLTVRGKGGKIRYVPMAPELREILQTYVTSNTLPWDPTTTLIEMTDRGVRYAISAAGRKAQIGRPVSSHDLRMTFGTVIYAKTKDLRVTQELLGHSDPKTTERYTGISEASKRAAVTAALP